MEDDITTEDGADDDEESAGGSDAGLGYVGGAGGGIVGGGLVGGGTLLLLLLLVLCPLLLPLLLLLLLIVTSIEFVVIAFADIIDGLDSKDEDDDLNIIGTNVVDDDVGEVMVFVATILSSCNTGRGSWTLLMTRCNMVVNAIRSFIVNFIAQSSTEEANASILSYNSISVFFNPYSR